MQQEKNVVFYNKKTKRQHFKNYEKGDEKKCTLTFLDERTNGF